MTEEEFKMLWNFQDELLKELEDLQNQDLEDELLNIPSVPATNLPAATSNRGNYRAQNLSHKWLDH